MFDGAEIPLPRVVSEEVAAYHEAGHVIAYLEHDIRIGTSTLISNVPGHWGRTVPADDGAMRKDAVLGVIICAGPMAEGLQDWTYNQDQHVADGNLRRWVIDAAWGNGRQRDRLEMDAKGFDIATWKSVALSLVERRWLEVERVAIALQASSTKTLSHEACIALID